MLRRAMMVRRWRPAYRLEMMLLKYCAVFRGKHEGRRIWVRALQPGTAEPTGWNPRSKWEKHAPQWNRIYDRAGAFLAGKVRDPCKGKPIHTGGRYDRWRMNPTDWSLIDCGVTRVPDCRAGAECEQYFWARRIRARAINPEQPTLTPSPDRTP